MSDSGDVKIYGPSGSPVYSSEAKHNAEVNARLDAFNYRLVPSSRSANQQQNHASVLEGELPKGATLAPRTGATAPFGRKQANLPTGLNFSQGTNAGGQYGSGSYVQMPRPYQPEFDSIDRQSYPVHRILANRYWRLFHKLDPVIGTGIDLYSEMMWSQFQLTGEGIDGEVKRTLESMIEETQLMAVLPYFPREFLVCGEAIPHTIFDESKGHWVHISMHNPDQLEVVDAPFLHMDPLLEFVPDDRLRQIVNSADPSLQQVRESIPDELVARIQSGQNIPLDTMNCTFMPRKLHPYDVRGTGIISRMWRILMYEDGVYNASIATARRHASPIKVAKLGNERTGWIPGPQAEAKMADLLARAELDPHAWVITNYGVAFEAWGTTDRTMTITRENETIERVKLIGLGLSKAFLTGEVTYSSASQGLAVFLQRLKSMRNFFESKWMIPKYFRQVSEINGWEKISKSEQRRGYRIKRANHEKQWVIPTIEWENSLSPRVDAEMLRACEGLERLNIKISKKTKMSAASLNFEKELRQIKAEEQLEREVLATPAPEVKNTDDNPEHMPLPLPPTATQAPESAGEPAPVGMPIPTPPSEDKPEGFPVPMPPWTEDTVAPVVAFLVDHDPAPMIDSPTWGVFHASYVKKHGKVAKAQDAETRFADLDEWLQGEGYLDSEIDALHTALVQRGALEDPLKEAFERFPEDSAALSDKEFDSILADPKFEAALKKKPEEAPDNFLTGIVDAPRTKFWAQTPKSASQVGKYTRLLKMRGHQHGPNCSHTKTAEFSGADGHFSRGRFLEVVEPRHEWQKRLDTSRYPDAVKNRIKFLENKVCDNWGAGFDRLWSKLNRRLDMKVDIDPSALRELISQGLAEQVAGVECPEYWDSMADIYAEGKLFAYGPLKFDETKRKRLLATGRTASLNKVAVTVDSAEERKVLDQIADSALSKVKNTVSDSVKSKILDALSAPGAYKESIVDLANAIVREERALIEQSSTSRDEVQRRMRELYDTQVYNIQRIMRTESINAYAVATLRGYKEQGIAKVKWNAHDDARTCNVCLALAGTEFDIDYLLSLGDLPIARVSHPQCRCFLTPVISFVTFDEFEKQYQTTDPTAFEPTQMVVDQDQVTDLAEVLRDLRTKLLEFKGVPAEYAGPMENAGVAIENAAPEYAAMMPTTVRIVPDVAGTPEFQDTVGKDVAESYAGQVTTFTTDGGEALISGFAARDSSASAPVIRVWADNIWAQDPKTQSTFQSLYDSARAASSPQDISPQAASTLVGVLEPFAPARRVQIGTTEALTLNKKFREMDEGKARELLESAGIRGQDADTIIQWRSDSPMWDLPTGGVIESDRPATANTFVSEVAAIDPEHYFVECMVAYYTMPAQLENRDPAAYNLVRSKYFAKQDFSDAAPGDK